MVAGTTAFLDFITADETIETITPAEYFWRQFSGNDSADVYLPDRDGEPALQVLHLNKVVRRMGVRITEYVATCFDCEAGRIISVTMRATQELLLVA